MSLTRADDRLRTGDLNLGKVALYQLSYVRGIDDPTVDLRQRPRSLSEPPGGEGRW